MARAARRRAQATPILKSRASFLQLLFPLRLGSFFLIIDWSSTLELELESNHFFSIFFSPFRYYCVPTFGKFRYQLIIASAKFATIFLISFYAWIIQCNCNMCIHSQPVSQFCQLYAIFFYLPTQNKGMVVFFSTRKSFMNNVPVEWLENFLYICIK